MEGKADAISQQPGRQLRNIPGGVRRSVQGASSRTLEEPVSLMGTNKPGKGRVRKSRSTTFGGGGGGEGGCVCVCVAASVVAAPAAKIKAAHFFNLPFDYFEKNIDLKGVSIATRHQSQTARRIANIKKTCLIGYFFLTAQLNVVLFILKLPAALAAGRYGITASVISFAKTDMFLVKCQISRTHFVAH